MILYRLLRAASIANTSELPSAAQLSHAGRTPGNLIVFGASYRGLILITHELQSTIASSGENALDV